MGSKDKFYGIITEAHGVDDIGFAQPTGAINSVAKYNVGKYWKYAVITAGAAHNLTKGQQVNISGTTYYDGPSIVISVPSTTTFVIKKGFYITATGSWDVKAAEGNWDAMMPIGAGVSGANLSLTFWKPDMQGGNDITTDYTADKVYPLPGGLKRVGIATAGNLRLFRAASIRPSDGRNVAAPAIIGYLPTSAASGATIDIIGTNFSTVPDRNAVRFTNGVRANVVSATQEILTIVVPTAAVSGPIAVIAHGGQNGTGPTFIVN